VFRCNIQRKKDGLDKAYPKYYVYSYPNDKFLMAAKKRPKNSTPNYMITMNTEVFEKDNNFLGKLRSNFFGTEFNLFDTGNNPKDTDNQSQWRCILSSVEYETNLFGLKGPRKMKVHLCGITETDTTTRIQCTKKKNDTLFEMAKKNVDGIISFRNKLPKWNESKQNNYCFLN
jgi:tubby and related proteins